MRRTPIFWGWWIVLAGFICAFCAAGARYSFSAFMPTLLDEFGWTRTELSAAYSIHMWLYVIAAPIAGILTDRFGPRILMAIGGLFIVVALTLTSLTSQLWHLYIFYGVIGLVGVSLCYMVPSLSTTRKWFTRRGGTATGIVSAGSGLGISLMVLVAASLIGWFSWRGSFIIVGVVLGVLCIIFSLIFMRKDPESMGLLPDGDEALPIKQNPSEEAWTLREASRTSPLWLLVGANFLAGVPLTAMLSQTILWAEIDLGIGRVLAAGALTAMTLTAVLSRIFGGWASDRWGRKPILYLSFSGVAIACLLGLGVDSLTTLYVFAIAFGFFYALVVGVWPAYLGDIYGRSSVGALYGVVTAAAGIAGGTGPIVYAYIHDTLGSYNLAFIISAVLCIIGMVLIFLVRPVKSKGGGDGRDKV